MSEQLELMLQFENQINVIEKLKRINQPLISKVQLDEATEKINKCFDFDFDGTNRFYPFELPEFLKDIKNNFSILCIVGASGTGKSTFSKYYGEDKKEIWNNEKCILSNIDDDVDVATQKLCAVGLNSIPTWTKPYEVLSVGEKFRASLARKIKDNCVIDEFTSNVDRNVALSCSKSIGKYIRKNNIKGCVFVSCHKDFIDCLCPDYVVDLDDGVLYDTRRLLLRRFELSIFEKTNKDEIWQAFRQYHYLSSELNIAAKCFVAYLQDELVACCYVLPQPGVSELGNAWRIHRLVVKPDYQGLGIGSKLLEYVCEQFDAHNKIVYLRSSNIKLINYMKLSNKWFGDGKLKKSSEEAGELKHRKVNLDRLSASFKYVGGHYSNLNYSAIEFTVTISKEDKHIQLDLFDIIGD